MSSLLKGEFVLVVCSNQDPASRNIAENLRNNHGFQKTEIEGVSAHPDRNIRLVKIETLPIYVEPMHIPTSASAILFASKHVSSTKTPAMTVHATGNLTKSAKFGGNPEEVSFVDPGMIRRALRALRDGVAREGLKIEVTMEATHHGPTSFTVPVCFVEIGSEANQWNDPGLGEIAADAIMEGATIGNVDGKGGIGFGGTHYSSKFTRTCLDGDFQIGHVVPRHAFESGVTDAVTKQVIERTFGRSKTALIDWKGLTGNDRKRLLEILESWKVEAVRC